MRLRGQCALGMRTQWHQSPQLLLGLEREATAFFAAAVTDLETAHGLVYGVELTCFPHGITLPMLSDAEAALASALTSTKRAQKAFASISPVIVKACGTGDIITPLWKKMKRDDRDTLTATASWFEAADAVYHNITLLLSSVPVSAYTHALQRALATQESEDPITALGMWLKKVPEPLHEAVQNMMPSALSPEADVGIWLTDYRIDATGDEEWIHDNVEDGTVHSGYVLCIRTPLAKKYEDAVSAIGKYLLAEKKHGSGWTRLAHDRLYPWTQPVVTKTYTYYVMLPCTEPKSYRVRAKSWALACL